MIVNNEKVDHIIYLLEKCKSSNDFYQLQDDLMESRKRIDELLEEI